MKIAFIGQKGIPTKFGGVEKHVEELSVELTSLGHEVVVYSRKNYNHQNLKMYRGVKIVTLPSISTKNLDAISHTFLATIHALFKKYDVIHYHAIGPSSLSWIIKFFKKNTLLISTFHCKDYQHQKWGYLARNYLKFGEFISCVAPDRTIVVNKSLQNYCRLKYNNKSVIIPNGANINFNSGKEALVNWNLKENKYILIVSRLIKHKGIHYAIEAFKNLKSKKIISDDIKLVIVGDGFYTDDYVEYLHKLGKGHEDIVFTGGQNGEILEQLFSNTNVFVQPSESEGLSIALLEAMGYGLAPIVSNIAENLEAINEAGIYFENKNVADLEKKMQYLILNPDKAKEIGKLARIRVKEKFSWKIIAKKVSRLYENLSLTNSLNKKI